MTQAQLDRSIAGLTGESPRTIRRLGFGLQPARPPEPNPADLRLVVDCPFCGAEHGTGAGHKHRLAAVRHRLRGLLPSLRGERRV